MKEKLNMSRPEIGWQSKVKLLDSDRPRPVDKPRELPVLPEAPNTTQLTPEAKDSLLKSGGRFF
jgi:hypothetical protein